MGISLSSYQYNQVSHSGASLANHPPPYDVLNGCLCIGTGITWDDCLIEPGGVDRLGRCT